ncbi:MAG: RecX family transcriptional regulator, partial [Spirochaetaceae bacterium]|nr:RecX family transcriptional regulator [Spirochaetaceae bacterium]
MALIALTEHSALTMRVKLEKRGFTTCAIGLAIARLQESGLLDDRRFARLFAVSRLRRRAEGPSTLMAALRSRGVDTDTAASVVTELLGRESAPEERRAALEKAALRALKKYKGDQTRAREQLRELGF